MGPPPETREVAVDAERMKAELRRVGRYVPVAVAMGLAVAGCKKSRPAAAVKPVPVAALAAIPIDATAVVGLDVRRLARSRLVGRAVEQMLDRDPALRDQLTGLAKACGLDLGTQLESVHLALGPVESGARASLLIATGALAEATLTQCLQAGVGSGGGTVSVHQSGALTIYRLESGRHVLFFGFGKAGTIVLGPREEWVVAGLGVGPKVEASPRLGPALTTVDRAAGMWAVATVDPELGMALTRVSKGAISAGPSLVSGSLDPLDGLRAHAAFTMPTAGDARALTDYAKGELALGSLAAQALGLGPVLSKVTVSQAGTSVRFAVSLTDAEVKDVLAAIDRGTQARQDAQPPADAPPQPPATPSLSISGPDAGPDAQ
jgi:hypothetical protein